MIKSISIKIGLLFGILFSIVSFSYPNKISAHDVASVTGHVWMLAQPLGEFVFLPDIVIYRENNLGPRYPKISDCVQHYADGGAVDPLESCHYVHGGVESYTNEDGKYYFGPNHPGDDGYVNEIPVCADPTDIFCLASGGRGGREDDPFEFSTEVIMNNPPPVEGCYENITARCPSGDWGQTTDAGGNCSELNQCGINCGLNPAGLRPAFPENYTFFDERFSDAMYDGYINFDPNDLKKGGGRWITVGPTVDGERIDVPSEAPELWNPAFEGNPDYSPFGYTNQEGTWDGYELEEYFETHFPNDTHHYGYDFIWIPGDPDDPDPDPDPDPNSPPRITKMKNDIQSGRAVGTPSEDDNGYYCDDQNPVTYTMEVVDPNGSDDIDFIDFSVASSFQLPPNTLNPPAWAFRTLFAQKWIDSSGREYAENTFFVRDRDTPSWSAERCFDRDRNTTTNNIDPKAPTTPLDSFTARFTTPQDPVNYSLWCYSFDNHQWADGAYALGSLDGTQYDVWYLDEDIHVYGGGYEATLLGATDGRYYPQASYVAYDRNSNKVKAQFLVEFGTEVTGDLDHNNRWVGTYHDIWRVRDMAQWEDSTKSLAGETVHPQAYPNVTFYYHTASQTIFDMIPPTIDLDTPQPAGGTKITIPYNVKDIGVGADRVVGEALNVNQSAASNMTNLTAGSQGVLYTSDYLPAINAEVVGGDNNYATNLSGPFNPADPNDIRFAQWNLWDRPASNLGNTLAPAGVNRTETIDIGNNTGTTLYFYGSASDLGCNRSDNPDSVNYVSYDPWFATRGGEVYSGGSINGDMVVKDIDDTAKICTTASCPAAETSNYPYNYLRREAVLSSEWLSSLNAITTDHKTNFEETDSFSNALYPDYNYKLSDGSLKEWYPYLFNHAQDTMTLNPNRIQEVAIDNTMINPGNYCGTDKLCMLNATPSGGTLNITNPITCNRRTVIFVDGNLRIDQTIQNQDPTAARNGCVFIVSGNVTIDTYKTTDRTGGPSVYYEQIEAYIIADGRIKINSSPNGWGLQVWGGLIGMGKTGQGFEFNRSLTSVQNKNHPTYMIHYDPRYMHIVKDLFSNDEPTYTKEIGYKD